MTVLGTRRYGIRFADSKIPTVKIVVYEQGRDGVHLNEVARRHGWSSDHAINRALRWTREHGDPR